MPASVIIGDKREAAGDHGGTDHRAGCRLSPVHSPHGTKEGSG